MNEDLHNIDDLFRKALEENQELAAASVWDSIDKTLDKKKVVAISKKYKTLKWVAAVLLLFSLGMAMYILHIRQQNRELVKQNTEVKNKIKQKTDSNTLAKDSSSASSLNITKHLPGNNLSKLPVRKNDTNTTTNNDTEVTDNNKLINKSFAEKNIAAPIKIDNNIATTRNKENTTLQNQKKSVHKKMTVLQSLVKNAAVDSINLTNENDGKPVTTYNNNNNTTIEKNNTNYNMLAGKQKSIVTENLLPTLKNDFILSNTTALVPDNKILHQQYAAFNDTKIASSKKSKSYPPAGSLFSATIFFSPDIVSTEVKNDHPRFREEERNEIEKDEQIKFSSTLGILVDYSIGKNWKLESGITYSARKTDIHPKTIYARPDDDGNINYRFNCSAGYSYVTVKSSAPPAAGDSVTALASTNSLEYVGLPLYAKYTFTSGRFNILPGAGISFNFLTKGKIETTIANTMGAKNSSSDKIQGLKPMYMNGAAGIEFQYKFNKMLSLSFEPSFRFAISSINKDASVKTNLNSIGLGTGLVFKF